MTEESKQQKPGQGEQQQPPRESGGADAGFGQWAGGQGLTLAPGVVY